MHPLTVVFRCDSSSRLAPVTSLDVAILLVNSKNMGQEWFLCVSQDIDFNQVLKSEFEVLVFRKQDQCYDNVDQNI